MGKYQGITDIPLNENGLNQAKACGNALKDVTFDCILSSDLSHDFSYSLKRLEVTAQHLSQ